MRVFHTISPKYFKCRRYTCRLIHLSFIFSLWLEEFSEFSHDLQTTARTRWENASQCGNSIQNKQTSVLRPDQCSHFTALFFLRALALLLLFLSLGGGGGSVTVGPPQLLHRAFGRGFVELTDHHLVQVVRVRQPRHQQLQTWETENIEIPSLYREFIKELPLNARHSLHIHSGIQSNCETVKFDLTLCVRVCVCVCCQTGCRMRKKNTCPEGPCKGLFKTLTEQ